MVEELLKIGGFYRHECEQLDKLNLYRKKFILNLFALDYFIWFLVSESLGDKFFSIKFAMTIWV